MRKAILIVLLLLPKLTLAQTNYQFTGQELDKQSELYYYGQRYYNQNVGRFTQPDPMASNNPTKLLTNPQALNQYSYALNNPVLYIDPTGLSSATTNPMSEGGWQYGDIMGEFNGVTAYYNGIGSPSLTYSCVDYAKRYVSQNYGITMGSVGNPNKLWQNVEILNKNLEKANSPSTFAQHNNGEGFVLPQEGDLLVWTDSDNGHIMVVTESSFDNASGVGYVEIIDQNVSNDPVRSYKVKSTESGYSIMRNKSASMAGWLSPVNRNGSSSGNSNTVASPVTQPQIQPPQQSFFQRLWSGAKRLFGGLF